MADRGDSGGLVLVAGAAVLLWLLMGKKGSKATTGGNLPTINEFSIFVEGAEVRSQDGTNGSWEDVCEELKRRKAMLGGFSKTIVVDATMGSQGVVNSLVSCLRDDGFSVRVVSE